MPSSIYGQYREGAQHARLNKAGSGQSGYGYLPVNQIKLDRLGVVGEKLQVDVGVFPRVAVEYRTGQIGIELGELVALP